MQPESLRELARKTAKSIVDHGSIPMATLKESIILQEKVDELLAKEIQFPEVEPFPEIPEVDLTPLEEKLDELLVETKKKDLLEYDLQIDEKTRKKLKGDKGEDGKDGINGVDGKDGRDGKDGVDGLPGKDGVEISPEQVREKLEELQDEERLDISSIRGTEVLIENIVNDKIKKIKPKVVSIGGASSSSSGVSETFETVSANLPASNATLNYDVNGDITDIVYSNGVTKTFNYTGADITSIVLSGSTPSGISLTKTLTYTSGDVTGIAYT